MVDAVNVFLNAFAIIDCFTDIDIGGYSVGSLLFGGLAIGAIIGIVLKNILKR